MSKMHVDEFEIDASLVQRLLSKQFPSWANLPIKSVPSAGTDNALYRLGNEMVVRLPRIGWAVDAIEKECEWLPKFAPFLPFSIPAQLGKGTPTEDYPWPWSVYRWLEGSNPIVGHLPDPVQLTNDLVTFIQALHKINLPNGPISNRGVPLEKQDIVTRKALQQLEGMIDVQRVTVIWETALQASKWSKPPVWVHGDLSPGNLLIQHGRLSAVIDFGILGIGDPACDLIIAWNLLPAHMRNAFRYSLGVDDATWERGRGWALSNALIALPYYKDTNPILANNARHVIQEVIEENRKRLSFSFKPAKSSQRTLIHGWLAQRHIKEWIHGVGLQNTLNGLEKFFQGEADTTYWIAYDKDTPFAFLITSPEGNDATTLDLFICDLNYLGKGIAVPMIREFLISQFPNVKRVLIDPEATNKRAIHVYQKVGFKIVGEFIASWHPVPHYQMELYMKDLLETKK
jgi:aminoglycoside phosphotransferase (APT) family kinase protein/RimJ/RimL family protein N-acetyltransferase